MEKNRELSGRDQIFSKEYVLEPIYIEEFCQELIEEERSRATIEKYRRDLNHLLHFLGEDRTISKRKMLSYKEELIKRYAVSSVNSMLAAANSFLKNRGWYECTVKSLKVQQEPFRCRERELSRKEYMRLLQATRKRKSSRLCLVMETLCSTGIRVSELAFITVEAVRKRKAIVRLKGKTRTVLLPKALCLKLKGYAAFQTLVPRGGRRRGRGYGSAGNGCTKAPDTGSAHPDPHSGPPGRRDQPPDRG